MLSMVRVYLELYKDVMGMNEVVINKLVINKGCVDAISRQINCYLIGGL